MSQRFARSRQAPPRQPAASSRSSLRMPQLRLCPTIWASSPSWWKASAPSLGNLFARDSSLLVRAALVAARVVTHRRPQGAPLSSWGIPKALLTAASLCYLSLRPRDPRERRFARPREQVPIQEQDRGRRMDQEP